MLKIATLIKSIALSIALLILCQSSCFIPNQSYVKREEVNSVVTDLESELDHSKKLSL